MPQNSDESRSPAANRARLRQLCGFIAPQWRLGLAALALMALTTLAFTAGPRLVGMIIDRALVPRDSARLGALVLMLALVELIRVGGSAGQKVLFYELGQRVLLTLRLRVFAHIFCVPIRVFAGRDRGEFFSRVTNDINALAAMISGELVDMLGKAVVTAGIVGGMFSIHPALARAALSYFAALFVVALAISAIMRRSYARLREQLAQFTGFMTESLAGIKTLKIFGAEGARENSCRAITAAYAEAQRRPVAMVALLHCTVTLVNGLAMATLIWKGGKMVLAGQLEVGAWGAFSAYVLWLFWPLIHLVGFWSKFVEGMIAAERVLSVLDLETEIDPLRIDEPPARPRDAGGRIEFDGVWFAYHGEEWALRDVSLEIPAGCRAGLVGPTGAGKSTIIGLLLGFYEPQRGRVLIDGRDARSYDRRELRARFGVVEQGVHLFSGSVSDNIRLWDEDIEAAAAMEMAARHGLRHAAGDQVLSEGATNLSQGERQILAFARAWSQRPVIWLLDEAAAHIDPAQEEKLEELLESEGLNRTRITVAHRLASVRAADRIFVLHHGRLVEQGRHAELMARGGLYARMAELQRVQVA